MSTGNTERMKIELLQAVNMLPERYPGYRDALVQAAMDSIADTAEHDDRRRININQRFDGRLERIAQQLIASKEEGNT